MPMRRPSSSRPPGLPWKIRFYMWACGDIHRAEHQLMEALGQTLWQAQRDGRAPDESQYLALARAHLAKG
jgi:Domain of unknown function (DUF1841)